VPELVAPVGLRTSAGMGPGPARGRPPGMDEAAQRPLRLHGPDRARVALGTVPHSPAAGETGTPGSRDVLPPGVEVILVPVRRPRPAKPGRIPACPWCPGCGLPSQNAEYRSVNAPWNVLLLPGRPGPQRGLIEPGHPDAVIRVGSARPPRRQGRRPSPGNEWMNPSDTAAPATVSDPAAGTAPRDMLENTR